MATCPRAPRAAAAAARAQERAPDLPFRQVRVPDVHERNATRLVAADSSLVNEQSCYHMYFIDGSLGRLADGCPRLRMDYNGSVVVHLQKVSDRLLLRAPRPVWEPTGEAPCIVHAPGSSKYVLPSLQLWWDVARRGRLGEQLSEAALHDRFRAHVAASTRPDGRHAFDHALAGAYFHRHMLPHLMGLQKTASASDTGV